MKATIVFGVCLVGLAVGVVVFRDILMDTIAPSSGEAASTDASRKESVGADRMTVEAGEGVSSGPSESGQSSAEEAIDSRLVKRQQEMADGVYRLAGGRIVQMLTDSGLALSDSERIARQYAADVAECAITWLAVEATRQSISIDELLSRLAGAAADGGNPFDVIDRPSVEAYAAPCEADAMQRAGFSMPSDAPQRSEENIARLRECVEAYSNSDITDRATILELCAQEVFGD